MSGDDLLISTVLMQIRPLIADSTGIWSRNVYRGDKSKKFENTIYCFNFAYLINQNHPKKQQSRPKNSHTSHSIAFQLYLHDSSQKQTSVHKEVQSNPNFQLPHARPYKVLHAQDIIFSNFSGAAGYSVGTDSR